MEKTDKGIVEFDVKLKQEDLINYNLWMTYRRASTWALSAISVMVVVFVLYALMFKPVGYKIDASIIFTAIIAASYIFVLPMTIRFTSKKSFNKNKYFQDTFRYQISDKGIKVTVLEKETVIEWKTIYKVTENDEILLLSFERGRAYIIPKKSIKDKETLNSFKNLIKKNLDSSRRILKRV